jgi:hypothetical protein
VQERELDEWENALKARENGVVAIEHALGRAHMEYDAEHDRVMAIQQDYRARLHSSTVG